MENIDPEKLEPFQIPNSLLEKMYEFTGNSSESSRGFIIAYTDQSGAPMIFSRFGSQIIEMGIRKALEQYLVGIENVDIPFDINDGQE